MKPLEKLVRPNILKLKPYSSARDEYKGKVANVFLDANENPFNNPFGRYPDPLQWQLKERIAEIKSVNVDQIFLGNGSDEAIDVLFRIFCCPGTDNVVAIEPTYGMYAVCADTNDIEYRPVLLKDDFQPDTEALFKAIDNNTKLLFLCSPNNPTGNDLDRETVENIITNFNGIVVIDEAYIDFSDNKTMLEQLESYPNVVVLQTFSKAWGMAGIRLGMAFASPEIISYMNKVKYPYNVNILTQTAALEHLADYDKITKWIDVLLEERTKLMERFSQLSICEKIYPSNANFFLAKVTDAVRIYNYLVDNGIIVRNRSHISLCGNSLRITIGTPEENNTLIESLINMPQL
jgi:histidinol-phosphate aminotransferase